MREVQDQALAKLRDLALSDTGFVFDPYTGATFSVNPTGLALLRRLKEGGDREELIEYLRESFETGQADLHRDLDEFIHILRRNGLLPDRFTI